jgi:hypothetical protein
MLAKYPGPCLECGEQIRVGDEIKKQGSWIHAFHPGPCEHVFEKVEDIGLVCVKCFVVKVTKNDQPFLA